jgi:3-hydroxyisobutyrate dehydrogenase-like beta-hydroxyacid dehydrogenase
MMSFKYRSVGFIGLGAMGKPMAEHLAKKLPPETLIYVFDVVQAAVDELCTEFPNKVVKSVNAKEVAGKSVRIMAIALQNVRN